MGGAAAATVNEQRRFTNRPWSFSSAEYSVEQLMRAVTPAVRAHARRQARGAGRDVVKGDLKLPHRLPDGTVSLPAIRNALAILGGARGGVDLPSDVKNSSDRFLRDLLARGNRALRREGVEKVREGYRVSERLSPFFTRRPSIDREAGIVKGVKMLGLESSNRRRYRKAINAESAGKYEGVKVNLDHPDEPGQPRSVRDRFAIAKNARAEADGIYADLHFNPKHEWAESFAWWAENAPEGIGMSPVHVVAGEHDEEGWLDVESIVRAEHVDVVADAATSDSLFEGEGDMQEGRQLGAFIRRRREELDMSADELGRRVGIKGGTISQIERGEIDKPPEQRLRRLARALRVSFERLDRMEGGTMDWDTLTLENLGEHRPDLVEEAVTAATAKDGGGGSDPDPEIKKLREELDGYKAKEALREREKRARELIAEARLPDAAVSDTFMQLMAAAPDEDAMKALVADRRKLCLEASPVCIEQTDGEVTVVEGADEDHKKFAAYARGD